MTTLRIEENLVRPITNPVGLIDFLLAGNCLFTARSKSTGKRFTYHINKAKPNPKFPGTTWFCSVLTGPNNETDYKNICRLKSPPDSEEVTMVPVIDQEAPSLKGLLYILSHAESEDIPDDIELFTSGRCCRCGRTLTVPESIESGWGPECAGKPR